MPKKARRLALKCVLSAKAQENQLVLIDALSLSEPRTKEVVALLGNLPVQRSILIALPQPDEIMLKSARNIPGVQTVVADSLNVVDLLGTISSLCRSRLHATWRAGWLLRLKGEGFLMNVYDVIRRPVITEKGTTQAGLNKYNL